VVFVIVTDGMENLSREFKKSTIKEMIERQKNVYNWHFNFPGGEPRRVRRSRRPGRGRRRRGELGARQGGRRLLLDVVQVGSHAPRGPIGRGG